MRTFLRITLIAAAVALGSGRAGADVRVGAPEKKETPAAPAPPGAPPATPTAGPARIILPLAGMPPLKVSMHHLDELAILFPAFKHEPFETSGFNHLTLPFLYVSTDRDAEPNEALAFSFLLSNSIDWAPGNYCTRHAYFAFKRGKRYMMPLRMNYDRRTIAEAIDHWDATHAVGGTLRKVRGRYAGELAIYGRSHRVVFHQVYAAPRDYFQLVGDMAVDAIGFFGHKPCPALVEHLHRKRCEHYQSLVDLGKAAFAEEKTPEEFDLYEKILARDPGFADVRYWYANQRHWHDGDKARFKAECAKVLDTYPYLAALVEFNVDDAKDAALAPRIRQWQEQAEALAGADAPALVLRRMEEIKSRGRATYEELQQAVRTAARYPNEYWLLWYTATSMCHGADLGADCDLAASMLIAALRNRYLTGTGDKSDAIQRLGQSLSSLGRDNLCVELMAGPCLNLVKKGKHSEAAWYGWLAGRALVRMGQYEEAIPYCNISVRGNDPTEKLQRDMRNESLVGVAVAAATLGRTDLLEQVITEHRADLKKERLLFLLEAYRDALAGKPVDLKAMRAKSPKTPWWMGIEEYLFYWQMDLLAGKRDWRGALVGCLRLFPIERRMWYLYDAYDRASPEDESACFYEALDWLYGDVDPWVRQAAADYRQRRPDARPLDPAEVARRLAAMPSEVWPIAQAALKKPAEEISDKLPWGAVAAAIRQLLERGEFDQAQNLAQRNLALAVNCKAYDARIPAHHLVHRVEQARAKAQKKSAASTNKGNP